VAGGRGFGDRGTALAVLQRSVRSLSLTAPTRATRARWPDLQATASAADPIIFGILCICCLIMFCHPVYILFTNISILIICLVYLVSFRFVFLCLFLFYFLIFFFSSLLPFSFLSYFLASFVAFIVFLTFLRFFSFFFLSNNFIDIIILVCFFVNACII